MKDEDGWYSVILSPLSRNWPDKTNFRTSTEEIVSSLSSAAIPHRLPLFSVIFRCFLPSSAVPRHPLSPPTVPYKYISQIVGLVILPNDGGPANSRTRTATILSSPPLTLFKVPDK